MDSYFGQDTRRKDRGRKKYQHFKNGKHVPRTNKDRLKDYTERKLPDEEFEFEESRSTRKQWAQETTQIIQEHFDLDYIERTKYYPEELPVSPDTKWDQYPNQETEVNFVTMKTVSLLWALEKDELEDTVALNFASAKNPGGGFMRGAGGQEEALSVSSGLYWSLTEGPGREMYKKNKKDNRDCVYRSDAIWSQDVPLFRFDDGSVVSNFGNDPRFIKVISMPAVNYGAYSTKKSFTEEYYDQVMRERIRRVFQIALVNGCKRIILGPWGCGVFEGNLEKMIQRFQEEPLYAKFEKIYFVSTSEKTVERMEEAWKEWEKVL